MNTKSLPIRSIVIGLVAGFVIMSALIPQGVFADTSPKFEENKDSKFCVEPVQVIRTIKMIATAYSSSPDETDDTPRITASGDEVEDGIVANNYLKFNTRVRIDGKIYIVKDRMNARKGNYQVDIWMPSKQKAKEFGVKSVKVEILQS